MTAPVISAVNAVRGLGILLSLCILAGCFELLRAAIRRLTIHWRRNEVWRDFHR